jgi:iron complex transport system substrate-binding protein
VTLPYNNYHTNLELALANSWYIAQIVYPERFADSDPARKTDEICQMFVGIPCYEQLRAEFGGFGRLQLDKRTAHAN